MKTFILQAAGIFATLLLAADCEEGRVTRTVTSLNGEGWKFSKDATCKLDAHARDFDDSKWQCVEVPHDWAISGPFDPEANGNTGKLPWRGVGWYRRTIEVTAKDLKAVKAGAAAWLEFDGVMARPEVYVNGERAGGWDYGYMSFRVDVAKFVKEGTNVIAVRADTRDHHSRWYPGAGIYRAVRLVVAPAVHVLPGTEFVTTPAIAKDSATVRVEFELTNRLAKATSVNRAVSIKASDGKVIAMSIAKAELAANGAAKCTVDFEVRNPKLWDVESPNLYTATLGMEKGDEVSVRFGIREAKFTADDGFHLNGKRVQLNGVNLHSDMGPLGMAFNRSVMTRQLAIMKDMGANALRTSHNACDPQVLELCDEMGIIVWNECFDKWNYTSGRRIDENLEEFVSRNLRQFVRRDRNHASVVMWSIGNEIDPNGYDWSGKNPKAQDGMSAERFRLFRNAIREFDTTRPVGIGCCHAHAIETGMFAELDMTGWNYNAQYRLVKAKHPDKPCVYSESASALSSYGAFEQPPANHKADYDIANREVGAYEHNAAKWSDIPDVEFDRMEKDRYCAGEFVWTGIDYLGEPTPYVHEGFFPEMKALKKSELARSSYFGIVDLTGIPKERYWIYRAHWNKKSTTVHISPHWNWEERKVDKMPVYVYTDGDEAELFLNGRSLGKRVKGVSQRFENMLKGKFVDASSIERNGGKANSPANAVDGTYDSRWCASSDKKGEWWQVDLGGKKDFAYINVIPEQPEVNYAWRISTSDDGKIWREYSKKALDEKQSNVAKKESTRFIRITFDDMKKDVWASIREVVVCNDFDQFRINPYYDVCDNYRLRWFGVPYEKGELKAVAYKNGSVIGEKVMRTADKVVAVKLTAEQDDLPADGETCVFVQVDVVDAKGVRDPWSKERVSFELEGPGRILGVGNGDARAHEAFTNVDSHPLYFGKAVAVVRRNNGEKGPIVLKASVKGLQTATITFK